MQRNFGEAMLVYEICFNIANRFICLCLLLYFMNKSQQLHIIKLKPQKMCDWIQQLFQPDYNPFQEEFLNQGIHLNNKTKKQFLVEEIHSYDQTLKIPQESNLQRKQESVPIKIEENTPEAKNEECISTKPRRKTKPSRRNQSMGLVSEIIRTQKCRKIKKKTGQNAKRLPKQYPTKNFLQNFKVAHLDFLQTKFSLSELQQNEVIRRLKTKNGIAMQDYRQLYSIHEFRQAFQEMFRSKHLYRSMMLSRSGKLARINHLRKLIVFEQSFQTRSFERIN